MSIITGEPIWAADVGVRRQTRGAQPWHVWRRYPAFGASFCAIPNGKDAHGTVFGVLPFIELPIYRFSAMQFNFRWGTGLCWVTKPYRPQKNPDQNTIGSHLNNITQFRLGMSWRITNQNFVQAGAVFTHVSNGASRLPNLGINQPGIYLQTAWLLQPVSPHAFVPCDQKKRGDKVWGGILWFGFALSQYDSYFGPVYSTTLVSGGVQYHVNRVNRLTLSLDTEYNDRAYHEGLKSGEFETLKDAHLGATRMGLALGDEFLFGPVGLEVLAGTYFGNDFNKSLKPDSRVYSRFTVRYYIQTTELGSVHPFLGVSLKAHRSIAEFVVMSGGMQF